MANSTGSVVGVVAAHAALRLVVHAKDRQADLPSGQQPPLARNDPEEHISAHG